MLLPPVLGAAAAVGGWWAAVEISGVSPFFVPGPPDIVRQITERASHLLGEAVITLFHLAAGFGLAAGLGLSVAVLLTAVPWLQRATLPMIVAIQAVPKVAVAPLLLIWVGYGHAAKIVMAGLLSYFPILIAAHQGLRATPAEVMDLARSMCSGRWRTFRKVRIPYALPQVFVGLKLGVTMALIGAVVAQISTPNAGLGAVIVKSVPYANTPLAFAAIVLLSAIGIGGFYLLVLVERVTVPWVRATIS